MSHARSPGQDAAALDRRSVSPRPQRVTELSGSPPTRSPSPTRGGRNPGRVDTGSPSLSRASWHSMPGSPETSAAGSPSARSARSIRSVASRRSIASIMQDAVHELDQKAGRHALLSPGSPSRRRRSSSPVHGRTKRTVLVRNASESRILVHKAPTRHQLARGQSVRVHACGKRGDPGGAVVAVDAWRRALRCACADAGRLLMVATGDTAGRTGAAADAHS